jgi:hypothetical protein
MKMMNQWRTNCIYLRSFKELTVKTRQPDIPDVKRGTIMLSRKSAHAVLILLSLALATAGHGNVAAQEHKHPEMNHAALTPTPSSIEAEHKEIHEKLATVIRSKGKTGAAGKEVESLLRPHFEKEEQFALPPLGLLSSLAAGTIPPNADAIIKMTDQLKAEMPQMLAEHKKIVGALQRLRKAAQEEHKKEAVQFADRLSAHAVQEEEILYPGAVLVGEYLKLRPK